MLRRTGIAVLLSLNLAACNNSGEKTAAQSDTLASVPVLQDTAQQAPVATGDNSQNSLDWNGTYEATLPCADCPGIKIILTLIQDNTFTLSSTYQESNTSTVTEDKGTMTWQNNGSIIHLKGRETDLLLKVGENKLIQLDRQGKEIDGPLKEQYVFTKK